MIYLKNLTRKMFGIRNKLRGGGDFITNASGVAAIEAAFIIPIMLVVVFATIEFGFYFMQSYQVSRAASALAGFIQTYEPNRNSPGAAKDPGPADAAAMNGALANMAGNLAGSLPDKAGFCVSAHASKLVAKNVSLQNCGNNSRMFAAARYDVQAGHSAVPSQGTYYVPVVVSAPYKTITGVESLAGFKMPTTLKSATVITINPATALSPAATCGDGESLVYDAPTNKNICQKVVAADQCPPVVNDGNPDHYALQYNPADGKMTCHYRSSSFSFITCAAGGGNGFSETTYSLPCPVGKKLIFWAVSNTFHRTGDERSNLHRDVEPDFANQRIKCSVRTDDGHAAVAVMGRGLCM